jgi:hypothetical protein
MTVATISPGYRDHAEDSANAARLPASNTLVADSSAHCSAAHIQPPRIPPFRIVRQSAAGLAFTGSDF